MRARAVLRRARRSGALSSLALAAALVPGALLPGAPPPAPTARMRLEESLRPGAVVSSPLGVVVTAAPEASWAGVRMLEAGGNAVDAAVAAAFALTASEPGGSGLGGQTWMVIRLASGEERALSCPARAPMRIDRAKLRTRRDGPDLWGPMASAVPTTVATLDHALRRYGTMTFSDVLAPAIEAADAGYRVQRTERQFLVNYTRRLFDSEVLLPVYLTGPTGESGIPDPLPAGTCARLPALAETLRRLAAAGAADFYSGAIAATLDGEMRAAGGFVTRADLARVPASVLDVGPVRGTYRGLTALSVPAPAGGSALVAALQILDALPPALLADPGLSRGQAIVEAVRLARAEAGRRRLAEDVTEGPFLSEWLTRDWAARQAARIRPGRALPDAELQPRGRPFAPSPGTTQVSVVDAAGNAVSLTQTLGRYFGAAWAPPSLGFLLNAFVEPLESDDPVSPLFLGPGTAAPTPAAPVILLRGGRPFLVAGTGGSSRIPSVLLSFVAGLVDGRDAPADALARPRLLWEDDHAGPRVLLEVAPPYSAASVAALKAMGYPGVFALTEPGSDTLVFGGIHAIVRDDAAGTWTGLVDGRREGAAAVPSRAGPPAR